MLLRGALQEYLSQMTDTERQFLAAKLVDEYLTLADTIGA
jgi:hypothetical protein